MKTIDSKSETKTKLIKVVKLDSKNRLTVEKIMSGELKGQYTIKSQTRKFFVFVNSSLAAYNIDTNFDGDNIIKIEYGVFRMLEQAVKFAKEVKKNRFKPTH